MKKSELARHLDLMSDEVDENPPKVVADDESLEAYLPTDGEMLALRVGMLGALTWATNALNGNVKPGDPVWDARRMVGKGISILTHMKLEANDER